MFSPHPSLGERQQALGISKAAQGFLGYAELDMSPSAYFDRSSTSSTASSDDNFVRIRSETKNESRIDRDRKRDIFKKKISTTSKREG